MSSATPETAEPAAPRSVLYVVCAAWLLVAPLVAAPSILATHHPPRGRAFSGAFFFQDDYHQYLSFVEQARHGAVLFRNKFDLRPQRPFLLNVTWWAGGVLALPFGGDPRSGFLAVGVLGTLGLLAAVARLLGQGGLRGRDLAWGLALVASGGGLGWLRLWRGDAWSDVPDLGTLLFPFAQALVSAHAVVGTALLLGSLSFFIDWRAGGPRWPWIAGATLLGITRPYDLAVFGAVAGIVLLLDLYRTGRAALGRLSDLAWLGPVLFYDALVFVGHPSFSVFSGAQNDVPPPSLGALAWALGPAVLLAFAFRGEGRRSEPSRIAALGALVLVALLGLLRLPFTFQLVNALGALLLVRAALALPRRALPVAVLCLCPTSLLLLGRSLDPPAYWFPPADYTAAALVLRERCRPQEVVLAPVDPGLVVASLTPCSLALGHRVLTPDLQRRVDETRRFYDPATSPAWRRALLDRLGVRYVLLPPRGGALLEGSGFAVLLERPGLEVWAAPPPR